jgi:hypothetical protein
MNYIKRLEMEKKELNEILGKVNENIIELHRYLNSEKFYNDPYVNKSDVIYRLADAMSLSNERR